MDKDKVVKIKVRKVHGKRITGWSVKCPEHATNVAYRTRQIAIEQAKEHATAVHGPEAVLEY